jgi:hypothetical protein
VAPVQWRGPPREPPRYNYAGVHGIPRAYGGGVCAVATPHSHGFPPVPAAAFTTDAKGYAVETRRTFAYIDAHRHHGATCFLAGWHMHLEGPAPGVLWDEERAAYVSAEPLE